MAENNLFARLFGGKRQRENGQLPAIAPKPMAERTVELPGCHTPDWADMTIDLDDPEHGAQTVPILQEGETPFFFRIEQDVTLIHIPREHPLLEEWQE